jgi:hypothetical protein
MIRIHQLFLKFNINDNFLSVNNYLYYFTVYVHNFITNTYF